jgi:hypothetical protein
MSAREFFRLLADLTRVLWALPAVEADRHATSPQRAALAARRRATLKPRRSTAGRRTLRRAISFVDAVAPRGPNCLRRSLLEMSLDAGASEERLLAGFRAGGGIGSGHAWLESEPVTETYDAVFPI